MEDHKVISELVIIMFFAIVSVFLFQKLKQSPIIGYFLAGMLIGPHGLALVPDIDKVNILAEIGVILLLFTIGLELSIKRILEIKRISIFGGMLQICITIGIALVICLLLDLSIPTGIFIGCVIALSSSAIVLQLWRAEGQMESVHGRVSVGILVFQDIAVAPMMIILPSLFGDITELPFEISIALLKAVGFLVLAVLLIRFVMPYLLFHIAKTKNRELFSAMAIFFGLGAAWTSSLVGLSLSLGAFFAGLLLSESEYSEQIKGYIIPFKDAFVSLFFISVGMLLDLSFFIENILVVLLIVISVIVFKFLICFFISILFRYPIKNSLMVGISLMQIGEFSLVLLGMGFHDKILDKELYQLLLSASIVTMIITPYMVKIGLMIYPKIASFGNKRSWFINQDQKELMKSGTLINEHIIIGGFGTTGQHLAQILETQNIPFIALDIEAPRIKKLRKEGVPIFYGDTSNANILHSAAIHKARCIVITVPDPGIVRSSISLAKSLNPDIHIIVRTKFLAEYEGLLKLGVDEIVFEEFEMVMEMGHRVLRYFRVPRWEVSKQMQQIRNEHYDIFRTKIHKEEISNVQSVYDCLAYDIYPERIRITKESELIGKSLAELDFRRLYSVFIFSIVRDNEILHLPKGDLILLEGDELIIAGKSEKILKLKKDLG